MNRPCFRTREVCLHRQVRTTKYVEVQELFQRLQLPQEWAGVRAGTCFVYAQVSPLGYLQFLKRPDQDRFEMMDAENRKSVRSADSKS